MPAGWELGVRGGRGFQRPQGALSTLPFQTRPLTKGLMPGSCSFKDAIRKVNGVASEEDLKSLIFLLRRKKQTNKISKLRADLQLV